MEKTKVKPEFDVLKTLQVIENDKVLDEIFMNDQPESYDNLRSQIKRNTLSSDILNRVKEIFERLILQNKKPLAAYLKADGKSKKPKLPKHYGKQRILDDINKSNGKSELDRAMLALNDMRNIYARLKRRCIKDKLKGEHDLTKNDLRDIIATVRIMKNKLVNILNK
jgi:hypothetical protein